MGDGEGDNGRLDLLGTYEAHLILGVERSRIARWLDENAQGKAKIPEPVARLMCGPIWKRADIERKLRQLAADAGVPPDGKAFDTWATERSVHRARQAKIDAARLEEIIRRPVTGKARRELASA